MLTDPALPFLGVHVTQKLDGKVFAGPNAMLCFSREGYALGDVNVRDMAEVIAYPGLWRIAAKQSRWAVGQLATGLSTAAFVSAVRRLVPSVSTVHVVGGRSGVRALALNRDGSVVDDFLFERHGERALSVRNASSPAATGSLALGDRIATIVLESD